MPQSRQSSAPTKPSTWPPPANFQESFRACRFPVDEPKRLGYSVFMMIQRHGNTGREMAQDSNWMKVARKHYVHGSGVEVRYDCNRWGWEVVGTGEFYAALWAAKHRAERMEA